MDFNVPQWIGRTARMPKILFGLPPANGEPGNWTQGLWSADWNLSPYSTSTDCWQTASWVICDAWVVIWTQLSTWGTVISCLNTPYELRHVIVAVLGLYSLLLDRSLQIGTKIQIYILDVDSLQATLMVADSEWCITHQRDGLYDIRTWVFNKTQYPASICVVLVPS